MRAPAAAGPGPRLRSRASPRAPLRAAHVHLRARAPPRLAPQTPEHPHGDGSCVNPCDCGEGVPCGEYLWNHTNGTMLRDWLINEHLLGPTGLGNPAVSGFYVERVPPACPPARPPAP